MQRKQATTFTLPSGQDVLTSLGLDKWRDSALLQPSSSPQDSLSDIETGEPKKPAGGLMARKGVSRAMEAAALKGRISPRMAILIVYLAVLHLTVMVMFTRRNDLQSLCRGLGGVEDQRSLPW